MTHHFGSVDSAYVSRRRSRSASNRVRQVATGFASLKPCGAEFVHEDVHQVDQRSVTLSVVIPVYNEEKNLSILCQQVQEALSTLGRTYEIIVVDDSDGRSLHA